MKKTGYWPMGLLILLIGLAYPSQGHAQFLKDLGNKVKETAKDHTLNDAGNATNKTIDKAEDSVGKKGKKHKKDKGGNDNADGNSDANSNANSGNKSDEAPGNTAAAAPTIKSYENYDFVPGDKVIFADDFTGDMDGEFPSHWNLTAGQAVINKVTGKPAFCLTQGNYCRVYPRMKNVSYLTDPFTIEFDAYTDGNGDESPILFLKYTDSNGNSSEGDVSFDRANDGSGGEVSVSGMGIGLSSNLPSALAASYDNKWHHCAVIYKNGQLKCYVDQYRVLVVPNLGVVPTAFGFGGIGNMDHPIMITNVRVASGGSMNMVGKKFTASKIVTHGIHFDIDKATIEPESMGTLNMIVRVMTGNPDLKFEVDGHTDNTGDAAHNLTLSKQRADAVMAQLEKMGITASRLSAKGFGDTKPMDSNDSQEGRANNRRVEFVRM